MLFRSQQVIASLIIICLQRGRTALHEAVSNGHQDVVRMLMKAGADVKTQDNVSTSKL